MEKDMQATYGDARTAVESPKKAATSPKKSPTKTKSPLSAATAPATSTTTASEQDNNGASAMDRTATATTTTTSEATTAKPASATSAAGTTKSPTKSPKKSPKKSPLKQAGTGTAASAAQQTQPAATAAKPATAAQQMDESNEDKKEIYTYGANWNIYAMNWSVRPDKKFRIAIGSFIEEYANKVEIVELDEGTGRFSASSFDHPYPATKIMWLPDKEGSRNEDLLATTGDYLRLWKVTEDASAPSAPSSSVSMKCLLNNNKNSEFCAPLTSFDWNETDPSMIGTSSIDTTCTIWNIETQQAKTQLIAHDKEVYDIAFAPSTDVFASVGADGSVRMFDLRSLEHSTIIYETPDLVPLLRLCWNKQDHHYLATFLMDESQVVILDIRKPSMAVAELRGHSAAVNSIAWAPHSACHICTGGDDRNVLIWDISPLPNPVTEPLLAYCGKAEINTLQWSASQPEWVAITFNKNLQILRV